MHDVFERLAPAAAIAHHAADSDVTGQAGSMAHDKQTDLLDGTAQGELFEAPAKPAYRPNPDKVRARLEKLLGEARAAQAMPWEPSQFSLYRLIFPQMTLWLPDDEALQYRLAFEAEMERLAPCA
jgi:hypothetical protein